MTNTYTPKDSTTVLLIRHGETINAKNRCYNGHFNVPLSKDGKTQIEKVAQRISHHRISAIYSSDLDRSKISASIIAKNFSLPVTQKKSLREISFGRWEGMPYEEIKKTYPDEMNKRCKNFVSYRIKEGGENLNDLSHRVIPTFSQIVKDHINEIIVLVLHGGVNRLIIGHTLHMEMKYFFHISQKFAALNILTIYPGNNEAFIDLING